MPGVVHGMKSYLMQDEHGQVLEAESISAGLDYAAVGPEHAWLHDSGRAEYTWIGDEDALVAFQRLAREEGLLAALESAHAVAHACRLAPSMGRDEILLVNLSGRGDKDVISVQKVLDAKRAVSPDAQRPVSNDAQRPASNDAQRPVSNDEKRPVSRDVQAGGH